MQTLEDFKKRLNNGEFKDLGGARKSIGKGGPKEEPERGKALALADKHFAALGGTVAPITPPKAKAPAAPAPAPAARPQIPKPAKRGKNAAAPAATQTPAAAPRRRARAVEPVDTEQLAAPLSSFVGTSAPMLQLELHAKNVEVSALAINALMSAREVLGDEALRPTLQRHIDATLTTLLPAQTQAEKSLSRVLHEHQQAELQEVPRAVVNIPGMINTAAE